MRRASTSQNIYLGFPLKDAFQGLPGAPYKGDAQGTKGWPMGPSYYYSGSLQPDGQPAAYSRTGSLQPAAGLGSQQPATVRLIFAVCFSCSLVEL